MWWGFLLTFCSAMVCAGVTDLKYDGTPSEIYLATILGAILAEAVMTRINLWRG